MLIVLLTVGRRGQWDRCGADCNGGGGDDGDGDGEHVGSLGRLDVVGY